MNTFRQIPLHMLLLAGLVAPLAAEPKTAPGTRVTASSEAVAYAGLNVGSRAAHAVAGLADGVGVQVGFIDPSGPSFGKVEEGDILTRLDDQVLFNAEQFRALVRTHQPGDKVKLTLLRGAEPQLIELKLGTRQVARSEAPALRKDASPQANSAAKAAAPGRSRVIINGNAIEIDPNGSAVQVGPSQAITIGPDAFQGLPPGIRKQLEDLGFSPGLMPSAPAPRARAQAPAADALAVAPPSGSSSSHSFSFSFGNGASSTSNSVASDGEGTVSLETKDGKKHAVIKDADGKTLFDGEVTTPEQLKAMPPDLRRRLKIVEGKGFSIPGFPLSPSPSPKTTPAEEPQKKYDPKQGA